MLCLCQPANGNRALARTDTLFRRTAVPPVFSLHPFRQRVVELGIGLGKLQAFIFNSRLGKG